jgi:hypothetical protein
VEQPGNNKNMIKIMNSIKLRKIEQSAPFETTILKQADEKGDCYQWKFQKRVSQKKLLSKNRLPKQKCKWNLKRTLNPNASCK